MIVERKGLHLREDTLCRTNSEPRQPNREMHQSTAEAPVRPLSLIKGLQAKPYQLSSVTVHLPLRYEALWRQVAFRTGLATPNSLFHFVSSRMVRGAREDPASSFILHSLRTGIKSLRHFTAPMFVCEEGSTPHGLLRLSIVQTRATRVRSLPRRYTRSRHPNVPGRGSVWR